MPDDTEVISEDDIIVLPETYTHDVDISLPRYAVTDNSSTLEARIASTPGLALPILNAPSPIKAHFNTDDQENPERRLQRHIVGSFFRAVQDNQDDVVADFISRGLVSPDVTSSSHETPLLAAVRCSHIGMLRRLLSLGALVDGYGRSQTVIYRSGKPPRYFQRTPLQYAAEKGHLAIVKVLMEEFGADDSLIAPDGALALRLAAQNGHEEVVAYLPARKGGAWKRWKAAHEWEMERIRAARDKIFWFVKLIGFDVPKVLFWYVPKEVWKQRGRVVRWVKRQVVLLPRRAVRLGKGLVKGVKELPKVVGKLAVETWGLVRRIPGACRIVVDWLVSGVVRVSGAILEAFAKTISALHTALTMVITWCKDITLRDVWNGVKIAFFAVFKDLPLAVWNFASDVGEVIYKTAKQLFGTLGSLVYYIGLGVWHVVLYIPQNIWDMVKAVGRSLGKAFNEVMVQFDPKRLA